MLQTGRYASTLEVNTTETNLTRVLGNLVLLKKDYQPPYIHFSLKLYSGPVKPLLLGVSVMPAVVSSLSERTQGSIFCVLSWKPLEKKRNKGLKEQPCKQSQG